MLIVWDEPKRQANLDKHGFDFAEFETSFDFGDFVAKATRASRTGRSRLILIGRWRDAQDVDLIVTAIVSPLGRQAVALVSLRIASEKERAAYAKA